VEVHIATPVAQVCDLYAGLIGADSFHRANPEQLRLLADRLAEGHRDGHPGARVELANWGPDIENAVARGHGYPDWVAAQADQARPEPDFERCVEALLAGDRDTVAALLTLHPDLVTARSHWGHRATLLHHLAANGVEIYRQRVPLNAAVLARLLLDRGADRSATAHMYGAPRTTLGMLDSSGHPGPAGVAADLRAQLVG
jgi:hypothetical protein